MPERVCNRCWAKLRPAALSVAESQQVQSRSKADQDQLIQLQAENDSLAAEHRRNAELVQGAEQAAEQLKERELKFEEERAQSEQERRALVAKQDQMAGLLEQEHQAADQVREAMGALREQLGKEEAENHGAAEQLEELQLERAAKEEELEQKELELRALRAEYEELESDMFTPTLVQLNRLQAEQAGAQQALQAGGRAGFGLKRGQELVGAHFSGDCGIGRGLGQAVPTKGLGELDIPRMVEQLGMEPGDESPLCPYKLQADLLECSLGFKASRLAGVRLLSPGAR